LIILLSQTDWKVKYYRTEICADKGSTVSIWSSYDYPVMFNGVSITVEKRFWFIRTEGEPVDLKEDPEYKDRLTHRCNSKICDLRISGVRESDSAVYKFRFITNHQTGRYIGEPGVRLTVGDLQVLLVSTSVQQEYSDVQLKCFNRCDPKGLEEYVWFINGEETRSTTWSRTSQMFTYRSWNSSTDRISCSLRSSKTDQSPEVYAPQTPTVSLYPPTEILEGSSVTLTCSSDANPAANYTWFKENKDSPKSEEQMFTISDITAEDGGLYICVAQNKLGQQNSTVQVSVGSGQFIMSSTGNKSCRAAASPEGSTETEETSNRTILKITTD
uniref:Ig-like domain-containing protein n=1 Tax=Oryzias melastigma TaxID=30732 RepID=A0A3B3CW94_ORYME